MNHLSLKPMQRHIQRGLTLIELMTALVIGFFVIAGTLHIFIATKKTYLVQEQITLLQENGRFATEFLSRYLRLAGYRADSTKVNDVLFPAGVVNNVNFVTNGQAISGLDNDPNHRSIDSVHVRYHGSNDRTVRDCLNRIVCSNEVVVNSFYVDDIDGDGVSSLYCESRIIIWEPGSVTSTDCRPVVRIGVEREPLIEGVEDLEVLYGVSTSPINLNKPAATAHFTATELNAQTAFWARIVNVQLALLLVTDDYTAAQQQSYLFPPWSTSTVTANDLRLRHPVTTTINLRNRTP